MAIFGVLGLIVLAALVLVATRARHDDDSDDDNHSGPGGRRAVRIPVRSRDRQPIDRGQR